MMGEHSPAVPAAPTQVRHPWKTVARTLFQVLVGLAAALPVITAGLPDAAWLSTALAVSGLVTRAMASPVVNDLLSRWVPWLAAEPRG